MMNHCVPDISVPSISPPNKQSGGDDEIMELFMQNTAPVVVYPPDKLSFTKPPTSNTISTAPPHQPPENPPPKATNNQLHMVEDELALWLHYPLEEFYSELMLPNPTSAAALQHPVAEQTTENHAGLPQLPSRWHVSSAVRGGFPILSRLAPLERLRSGFTVVDSNDTPITNNSNVEAHVVAPHCPPVSTVVSDTTTVVIPGVGKSINVGEGGVAGGATSPSRSSATSSATTTATGTSTGKACESQRRGEVVCRKRKIREVEESFTAAATANATEPQNEELELESDEEKKHSRGSTASKRTRAAEVHNLSERRRRDRINEKMRTLQELIPRCNKSDKASMLDEAIEYIKSLQMQAQMMSMGCGMMPMMYPGMQQQFMPPIPYTPPIPALQAHVTNVMPPLAPRLPVQPFAIMPCVQPSNPTDSMGSPYTLQAPVMGQISNMVDPYHQYLTYQQLQMQMQMQMQALQSQTLTQPVSSKPASNKGEVDNEKDVQ